MSLVLRSNQQYELQKPLPDIGSQIKSCYYLVKDSQDPKAQKILLWTDFGPLRYLEDKSIQSLLKSVSQIEVNIKQDDSTYLCYHSILSLINLNSSLQQRVESYQ